MVFLVILLFWQIVLLVSWLFLGFIVFLLMLFLLILFLVSNLFYLHVNLNFLSRGFCGRSVRSVHWVVVVLCTIFCVTSSGPCDMNLGSKYDACGPFKVNFNVDYKDEYTGDVGPGFVFGNSVSRFSAESVCGDSNLFCFPSTLTGLMSGQNIDAFTGEKDSEIGFDGRLESSSSQDKSNLSWGFSCGNFKLLNGGVVSCSLSVHECSHNMLCRQANSCDLDCNSSCKGTLFDRKAPGNKKAVKSGSSADSSPLHVELNPPVLDWGQQYLYSPSLAFLTVTNTHSKHILQVYEPYITSTQFYPCNFSEMTLGPGEVASVCFVFWPTRLGLNLGHLVLQTGFGGFLIQIRGFSVESPYEIQPLLDLDKSSVGSVRKNVSLYNPFDDILYVEEVTAWISFSSGNTSHLTELICSMNNVDGYAESSIPSVQKWLGVRSGEIDVLDMKVRPHRKWEIAPHSSETIVELDFHHSQEKILGAFCMQLLRSSTEKTDVIMVPLKSEMGTESTYYVLGNSLSVTGELLMPCEDGRTIIVALSLRNDASYLLRVVKIRMIGETTNNFMLKFVEGLIVFPGTTSQVAVVTYTPVVSQLPEHPPEVPSRSMNCKLLIVTNDSSNPYTELLCNDIISMCSKMFSVGYEYKPETVDHDTARTGPVDSGLHSPIKASKMAEADELVLQNWRSQGTARGMSVLDSIDVLFPIVEIGTHHPRWIDVKNPSTQPVVMQLILNSGEIVDNCRDQNELLGPSWSSSLGHNNDITPSRYGFSIADDAVTEVYVQPRGSATFGPIIFHPSSRCSWKSSALIRNNLSGVEWLSLRGSGGSLSLVMFEGSDQLQAIDFKFMLPPSLNFSHPDKLPSTESNSNSCLQPFLKELYAKNTGDLPIEVNRIEILGKGCQLDGFLVHTCKGFALEPGESTKIIISHQTDFSAVVLQRDLQLALASDILVIPMKATLPMSMLSFCKRSILLMRVKKSWVPIILITSVVFLLFCRILPQVISFRSQDFILRSRKYSIATVRHPGKSPRLHLNQKDGSKFAMTAKINGVSRSIDDETLMSGSDCRSSDCQSIASEQGKVAEPINLTLGYQCPKKCLLDAHAETILPSSMLSRPLEFGTSVFQEAALPGNLTVKVEKEKGKKRRKKKGSGAGLPAQLEVSSSQSGNSTPSSPLSPVTSITPKRSWPLPLDSDQRPENRNPFSHIANRQPEKIPGNKIGSTAKMLEPIIPVKFGSNRLSCPGEEKPPTPRRMTSPVLLSSATFPSVGKSAPDLKLATTRRTSTSPLAPHARAPGSKLGEQTRVETLDKKGNEDDFKYDIWGDHLFGLHLAGGRSGEVYAKTRFATKYESDSFFLSGPQQVSSVGSRQED